MLFTELASYESTPPRCALSVTSMNFCSVGCMCPTSIICAHSVLPSDGLFHRPGTWRVAGSTGTVNFCVLCIWFRSGFRVGVGVISMLPLLLPTRVGASSRLVTPMDSAPNAVAWATQEPAVWAQDRFLGSDCEDLVSPDAPVVTGRELRRVFER